MCALIARLALVLGAASVAGSAVMARQGPPAAAEPPENPVIGTWMLVVEKSRYSPGPPPQRQTRVYQAHPKGVQTTVTTVGADGEVSTVEYTTNYDSIEYRVTGSAEADGIALRKVDEYTAEATLTHAGRVVGIGRRTVSKDGRTMTISFEDTRGVVHNVAVYEKVNR